VTLSHLYPDTRFYFLTLACDQVAKEGIPGAFAELGVYKGNTAFILAQTARQLGRVTYLVGCVN
jgi:hypothetical protein